MNTNTNDSDVLRPNCIPEIRYPRKAPDAIVTDGRSVFGCFDAPIKNLNIHEASRPLDLALPRFLNTLRIKEWEAYEVCFDEGFICGAIYDLGIAVFNILMFYDRKTAKVTANQIFGPPRKCVMNSLINSTSSLKTGAFQASISNHLEQGKVFVKSNYAPKSSKKTPMSTELCYTSCADAGVFVMPFGENRPLYTHKGFFKVEGKIKIGDREFIMNENSVGIIDDHKGYYPRHMHYDWITGMGIYEGKPMGINLCKNQALTPEHYSENLLWLNGKMQPLPPVNFERQGNGNWRAWDEHGMVDAYFEIDDNYSLCRKVLMHRANYIAPFGRLKGWVKDAEGNKIPLDGLTGMGEDISFDLV